MSIFTKEVIVEVEKQITFEDVEKFLKRISITDEYANKIMQILVKDKSNKILHYRIEDENS